MILISEITIKNFRSIVNQTFLPLNTNIFVGLNDAGKSNFLKALNLFFNNETDYGRKFEFDLDYSFLAPQRVNKAKEIVIQIKFEIPSNYTVAGTVIWTKAWRADGLCLDKKNREFAKYSKATTLLNRITYKYVPAIKSDNYFRQLLGNLYSSISAKADSEFVEQTTKYSDALKGYTQRISEIVQKSIGINSTLAMPRNQAAIFSQLSFLTQDNSENNILLEQRGDGIKSRHIPAILKFMAEQENKLVARGSVPYTTIWGYEEPENGIEMAKCFELARELLNYSKDIQLFATTHSPAFYSMRNTGVRVIHVCKDGTNHATIIDDKNDSQSLHTSIGILPLITPFISDLEKRLEVANSLLQDNFLSDIPTICVEGVTDKDILNLAIQVHSPELLHAITDGKIRILTRDNGCGTIQLKNWAEAWMLAGFRSKLYVLFDKDVAGKAAQSDVTQLKCPIIKSQFYRPSDNVKTIFGKMAAKGDFLFEMEHLLSMDFWLKMKEKGLTEPRDAHELFEMFRSNVVPTKSLEVMILEMFPDECLRETIVKYNPHKDKKTDIAKLVKKECAAGNTSILDGIKGTVNDLAQYFIRN